MASEIDTALTLRLEASLAKFERQMAKAQKAGGDTAKGIESKFANMNQRLSKSAEAAANALVGAVDKAEKGYKDLAASVDPAAAALQRYQRQQEVLSEAVKRGVIDQAEQARMLKIIKTEYTGALSGIAPKAIAAQRGMAGLMNTSAAGRFVLQNTAAQLGDVAVQLEMGTAASRVASQQLPQILGGFGALGGALGIVAPLLGTVAAVGIPLAAMLAKVGGESEDAGESVDKFTAALDDYMRYADLAKTSTFDLRKEFGDFADEVKANAEYLATLNMNKALSSLSAATQPFRQGMKDALRDLDNYREAVKDLERVEGLQAIGKATSEQVLQSREAMETFQDEADKSAKSLGLVRSQVEQVADALEGVEKAEGMANVRDRAQEALDLIKQFYPEGSRLPPVLEAAVDQLNEVVSTTAAATVEASELADELERGARASNSFGDYNSLAGQRRGRNAAASSAAQAGIRDAADKGILDLIARLEGTDKPGARNYNETLGYGKFTGGEVDLVNKTLREVLQIQKQMLAHPDNTFNSSAVGRYQIVGSTLGGKNFDGQGGLIRNLGLDMNERFTPELQDRLALELIRENGGDANAVRGQWEGVKLAGLSDNMITRAMGSDPIPGIDPEVERRNEELAKDALQAIERAEKEAASEKKKALKEEIEERKKLAEIRKDFAAASKQMAQDEQFEISLIGKSAEQQARLRTEYELTNKAKAEGISLTEKVAGTEQTYADVIRETAQAVGDAAAAEDRLTKARETAEEKTRFLNDVQQNLKDGLIGAIMAGDSFADTLGNVARMLAEASFQAALFGDGPFAGNGGGLFSGVLGSIFPSATPAVGSNASGTNNWRGGLTRVNENGGEIMNLPMGTQIIPHDLSRRMVDQSARGGGIADVRVSIDQDGNLQAFVERVSNGASQRNLAAYDRGMPGRVKQIQKDPRAR